MQGDALNWDLVDLATVTSQLTVKTLRPDQRSDPASALSGH